MDLIKLRTEWGNLSLMWKIMFIIALFILVLITARSILFSIAAWIVIIYFVIKTLSDWEVI